MIQIKVSQTKFKFYGRKSKRIEKKLFRKKKSLLVNRNELLFFIVCFFFFNFKNVNFSPLIDFLQEKSIIDLKSSLSDAVSQLEKLNGELKNREIEIASLKENDAKKIDELTKDFKNQIAGKDKNIEELKSEIIIKLKVLEDTQKELSDLKLITTQKNGEFEELTKKYTGKNHFSYSSKHISYIQFRFYCPNFQS